MWAIQIPQIWDGLYFVILYFTLIILKFNSLKHGIEGIDKLNSSVGYLLESELIYDYKVKLAKLWFLIDFGRL